MDPLLSLAISIHRAPGVYALLLGSGLSLTAGVPTGWGIIVELVQRIARLQDEEVAQGDIEAWYRRHFDREVEYGALLRDLAKTPAERAQLLREYFEPNQEERDLGLKLPTPAHHAIAEMVEQGYIRVIVTTNFDRLLEQALHGRGIIPTVIATADAVRGARPLAHSSCTVIKVHGDYLDARIRNTPEELASYEADLDMLLDQVIDEYGMIICGWSATWDPALRAAFERAKGHRFSTYWAAVEEPSEFATEVITARRADVIRTTGADQFFRDLSERVVSLKELGQSHPLSAAVAVQTLKRYLPNPVHRIRLYDLVMDETSRVLDATSEIHFPLQVITDTIAARVRAFDAISAPLAGLMAAGAFHARGEFDAVWAEVLERMVRASITIRGGSSLYINLRRYPALLAMYASGVAAVAAEEYGTLASILTRVRLQDPLTGKTLPIVLHLNRFEILNETSARSLREEAPREHVPQSEHLAAVLEESLRPYVGGGERYANIFDRFEYLAYLVHGDEQIQIGGSAWAPLGIFAWRDRDLSTKVEEEIQTLGADWPPLRAGLFAGDVERLKTAKRELDHYASRVRQSMF